jgi:hypothetical protein
MIAAVNRESYIEAPVYRARRYFTAGGIGWKEGEIVERFTGWPTGALEPQNLGAERICEFFSKHQNCRSLPDRPFDWRGTQKFYLPYLLYVDRGWLPEFLERYGAPMYRADIQFADRTRSGEVTFLGWPRDHYKPANKAAEKVIQYLESAGNRPLPLSPWDEYSRSLWLPALPATVRRAAGFNGRVDEMAESYLPQPTTNRLIERAGNPRPKPAA